ncbi:MAG: tRNA (adenosine(37)-N6)-threonylcarbamoyltransferase complex transferase subunit TsaD [Vallitaleaceae bacterium]|nr:tRNA (adenosine(37)-N6)-threonylcarbamoyltransferase complex transferase subunit TsaD [Vallitaleaceae bacterium]
MKEIVILAIETSCDETAAAIVVDGRKVLSNVISSQIDLHKKYGGVVPEIASRKHIEKIDVVIDEAMEQAGLQFEELDAIAVTYGPGLVGALLVGVAEAKALAYALGKPLIGVHHIEGHIAANYIENPEFEPPFLGVVVSGGHTHLVHVHDYQHFTIIGKTKDDAIGEAFDKVARSIGLGYPGGPKIDKISKEGNENSILFPKAQVEKYDFSFSGVKSAVLNYLNQCEMKNQAFHQADVAASFQKAVVEAVVEKAFLAVDELGIKKVALAGGVAANTKLRARMKEECDRREIPFQFPSMVLCTDNAAMIGAAAYYEFINGKTHGMDLNAIPNLKLTDRQVE